MKKREKKEKNDKKKKKKTKNPNMYFYKSSVKTLGWCNKYPIPVTYVPADDGDGDDECIDDICDGIICDNNIVPL